MRSAWTAIPILLAQIAWTQQPPGAQIPLGGYLDHTTGIASTTAGTAATGVVPAATNAMDESYPNCTPWSMLLKGGTPDPGYIYTPPPLLPTALGTIPGCYKYANPSNHRNYPTLCGDLAYLYGISSDQLLAWNPTLDTNISTCTLSSSNSYCVLQYENSTAPSDDITVITTYCYPEMNATEAGTDSNCNCFSYVMLGDAYWEYGCDDFAEDYEISMSELLEWNSWLTGDCDTALYANLNESATRAVCIGTSTVPPAPTTLFATTTQTTAYIAEFD